MNIADIKKGIQVRPPRIILAGVEKIGKSTFAAGAPNPIVIPIVGEEGIDSLDVASTPVVTSYSDLIDAITMLSNEEHDFETVVIDSVSTLSPIIDDMALEREGVKEKAKLGGGYGHQFDTIVELWREIMGGLDYLRNERGMGCILIGHVVVKAFTDPVNESYDTYELDIHKKASSALMRWSDCILFANNKVAIKQDEKSGKKRAIERADRVLFTQRRPAHPGGGRGVYGQLPYELDLSWGAFAAAVENAGK